MSASVQKHPTPGVAQAVARKRGRPRGKDRVADFVRKWFDSKHWEEGARIPSIREIAQLTNASPSTVYLIVRKLTAEGKIRTKLGNGSFFVGKEGQNRTFRVALNIPRIEELAHGEYWKNGITSGILAAVSEHKSRMLLMPCSNESYEAPEITAELLAEREEVDALILFPCQAADSVRTSYENAGKIVVNLNAPADNATANFVSPDYQQVSFLVGRAFAQSGRKRILFLSHVPLGNSASSRQRFAGLLTGVGEALGNPVQCRIIASNGALETDGARAMKTILESGEELPDAIYCTSDRQAIGVLEELRKKEIQVPQAVSVVSGTGFDMASFSELTSTRQPLHEFGYALVRMVTECLAVRRPVPAVYLPMDVIIGRTTRPEENEWLVKGERRGVNTIPTGQESPEIGKNSP